MSRLLAGGVPNTKLPAPLLARDRARGRRGGAGLAPGRFGGILRRARVALRRARPAHVPDTHAAAPLVAVEVDAARAGRLLVRRRSVLALEGIRKDDGGDGVARGGAWNVSFCWSDAQEMSQLTLQSRRRSRSGSTREFAAGRGNAAGARSAGSGEVHGWLLVCGDGVVVLSARDGEQRSAAGVEGEDESGEYLRSCILVVLYTQIADISKMLLVSP